MAVAIEKERSQMSEYHRGPRMGRLFGDQLVSATELNRRGGAILEKAMEQPATITRNHHHLVLLRRELAAQLSALYDQVNLYTEVMRAIRLVSSGEQLCEDHPYRWLYAYDASDLSLLREELIDAIAEVVHGSDPEAVENGIHEWHESAIAAANETSSIDY